MSPAFIIKKQNTFIASKTRISLTKILTPSFVEKAKNNLPFITFQLKEKNMILQKIKRPFFEMEIDLLYKNKSSTTRPFDFSHTVAVFKLPESYKQNKLSSSIRHQAQDQKQQSEGGKTKKAREIVRNRNSKNKITDSLLFSPHRKHKTACRYFSIERERYSF